MNNKLFMAATGLLLAGGAGFSNAADISLYGQVDVSINARDSDSGNFTRDINMNSTQSALGFKGTEDLGNGLSAFFKIEYQTDVADAGSNGDGWTGRDQYLGLDVERFGKLTFGTASTAYKSPGSKIDAFYRTPLQSRGVGLQSNLHSGKGEEGQGRSTNLIRYDSPAFAGFGLTGTYTLDSDKQGGAEDDDPLSVGVTYKGGGFYAFASYVDTKQSNDTAAAQLGAKYTWNSLTFHGIYELDKGLITAHRTNGTSGNLGGRAGFAQDDGADIWSLGATYTLGNNLIGFDYGQGDDSNGKDGIANTADDVEDYDSWRIAGYHKFSNRTRVYLGYANQDFTDPGEDEIFSLGMRHNF